MSAETQQLGPYAQHWRDVFDSGLGHPLPIEPATKRPAVPGHSGHDGYDVTPARAEQLALLHPGAGLGVRLGYEVIGLDFDVHKRPTLMAEFQARFGWIPTRVRSTARDDGSGIYLLRVPEDQARRYLSNLKRAGLEEIDVLHHGYRHANIYPSINPATGTQYRWLDGVTEVDIPDVGDLEELPGNVLEAITNSQAPAAGGPVGEWSLSHVPEEHREAYQAALDREGYRLLELTLRHLGSVAHLATGQRNPAGEGWEAGTHIVASWVRLGELIASPWTTITEKIVQDHITSQNWPQDFKAYAGQKLRVTRDPIEVPVHYGQRDHDLDFRDFWMPAADPSIQELVLTGQPDGSWATEVPAGHRGVTWERLVESYPLMGSKRVNRKNLFYTSLDEDGKEKVSTSFLPEVVARYVGQGVARGDDGGLWWYRDGVYVRDEMELTRRVAWTMGNDYTRGARERVQDTLLAMPHRQLPEIPDVRYINCANGIVDWATGTVSDHDPTFASTAQLSARYDTTLESPVFDQWISSVLKPEDTFLALDVMAYLMIHGNPFQKAVLLLGTGRNGKGTLLRLFSSIIGTRNQSSVTLQDMTEGKFEIADMQGKHINIAGDIDASYVKKTGPFKAITGNDRIQAQRKNGQPFEFVPWCVPVFSANELWRSVDSSEGYTRRWVVIPMQQKLQEGTFDEGSLMAERDAIFTKLVQRLPRIMSLGKFVESSSSQAALEQLREGSNSFAAWLAHATDPTDGILMSDPSNGQVGISPTELRNLYKAWCVDEDIKPKPGTQLISFLEARGYRKHRRADARLIVGLWRRP